jgi:hypothetical protein
MPQANLPDTITVPLGRNAAYGMLDVDVTKFAPHVLQHLFTYGVRQSLNDAIAERKDLDNAAIVAKATKRLDTFYSGELRVRNAGEPIDPVENRAWVLAKAAVRKMALNTPQWSDPKIIGTGDDKLTGDAKLEAVLAARFKVRREKLAEGDSATEVTIQRYLAAHPDVMVKAREAVEAEQAAMDTEGFEV